MSEINITNLPATLGHSLYQGDAFAHLITIKEDGVLVDLTGDSFILLVNDARLNNIATLEVGSGVTIVGAGQVQWGFSGIETDVLPTNCNLKYSFKWVDRDKTIEVGEIIVTKKL